MGHESLTERYAPSVNATIPEQEGVEVLAAPDHLAEAAVAALGWDGVITAPTVILGRRVVVVATLDDAAHRMRERAGWGPVTDRVTVSTWDFPELAEISPPVAVQIRGVLAPARHWRTGLFAAIPFVGLCPTAVLLPAGVARDAECLRYADHYGPTVIAAPEESDVDGNPVVIDAVDVVQTGRTGAVRTARRLAANRWVHEMVYDRVLAATA